MKLLTNNLKIINTTPNFTLLEFSNPSYDIDVFINYIKGDEKYFIILDVAI